MPVGPEGGAASGAGGPAPDPGHPVTTATGWYQRPVVQYAVFPLTALALAALGIGISLLQHGDAGRAAPPASPTAAPPVTSRSSPATSRTAAGSPTLDPTVHDFDRYLSGITDITVGDDNFLDLDTMAVVPGGTRGADVRLDSGRLFHGVRERTDDQGMGIINNADSRTARRGPSSSTPSSTSTCCCATRASA
ncbi:hypothetical protein ABTX81_22690 [Kitasatospora sp. NPDC097605]|uniref:hypothetical protein n=1 Tax=Kitasatospora sp. NPDC097605 TaxID=3157226 RepID=UPI00332536D5